MIATIALCTCRLDPGSEWGVSAVQDWTLTDLIEHPSHQIQTQGLIDRLRYKGRAINSFLLEFWVCRLPDCHHTDRDRFLFNAVHNYLQTLLPLAIQDTYTRRYGMHGPCVPLESVSHPQPFRIDFGVCWKGFVANCHSPGRAPLTSYPRFTPPPLWSKRHMPPILYRFMAQLCSRITHLLPRHCKTPPNSITAHYYPSSSTSGNTHGDTYIGFHTDSRPHREGVRVEQTKGLPVISVTFGATMRFSIREFGRPDTQEILADLHHGSVLLWDCVVDDHRFQHKVHFPEHHDPSRCDADRGRWAIICRWMDTVREYSCHERSSHTNLNGRDAWWLPE